MPPPGVIAARGVHPVDPFAAAFARAIRVRRGDSVLDLGCGAGAYGLATLARGAARVVFADRDPAAVACAISNARRAGLAARAEGRAGDLLAPVAGERFDAIVAALPMLPGPPGLPLARAGGPDGTRLVLRCVRDAPRHLATGGRLYLVLTDLAHPRRVLAALRRRCTARRLARAERPVSREEYDALLPGLWDHLLARCRAGTARLGGRGDRRVLGISLWEARLRPGARRRTAAG